MGVCVVWSAAFSPSSDKEAGEGGGGVSVIDGLDVFWGEEAHAAMATPLPPLGVGAVQEVDDITTMEV